jgi:hypothetical protein
MIVPLEILNELGWGFLKLAGSVSCIATTIFNVLDFGASVAKWIVSILIQTTVGWMRNGKKGFGYSSSRNVFYNRFSFYDRDCG